MQKGKNFDIKVRRMTRLKKRSNFMTNVYSFINKEKSQKVFSGMAIVAMLVLTVGVVPAVSSASVVNPGSIVVCKVVEDSNGNHPGWRTSTHHPGAFFPARDDRPRCDATRFCGDADYQQRTSSP